MYYIMGSNCDDSVVISRGSSCEALTCILFVFFPKEVLTVCPAEYIHIYIYIYIPYLSDHNGDLPGIYLPKKR